MHEITADSGDPERGQTRRNAFVAAGAAAAGLALPAAARASATGPYIVVDASGGGDYTDLEPAIAAAPAESTIEVRPGLYTISAGAMNPATGVTIVGSGYGTHIKAKNGLNIDIFRIKNDRVVIDSLRVDGNGPNQVKRSLNCIYFDSVGGKVTNCYVHDAAGYNIVGFPGAREWVIASNHSYSTVANNIEFPRENIELQGARYCNVVGNNCSSAGGNGIYVWNSSGDSGFNTVTGNVVQGAHYSGISLEDGAHDNSVVGNTCIGNGYGIWSNSNGSSGAPHDNTIVGNVVVASRGTGIEVDGGWGTVVADNRIRDNGWNGVLMMGSRDCTVRGNSVTGSQRSGIVLQDTDDTICTDNVVVNNGIGATGSDRSGIRVVQVKATCKNNIVSGNRCHDTQSTPTQVYGVTVYNNVSNMVATDNLVEGSGAPYGYLFSPSSVRSQLRVAPSRPINVTVGATQTQVAHGLPYTPLTISIAMTSPGSIWQSAGPSGQYIYLQADAAGRTAQVLVG